MSTLKILQIRNTIEAAHKAEVEAQSLLTLAQIALPSMHRTIELPKHNPDHALASFLKDYIYHVPDCVAAVIAIANDTGISKEVAPIVDVATNYFAVPPKVIQESGGLCALLGAAYLAHRLFEEINDRIMAHFKAPFIPMDMAHSNVLVHAILGESFANKLDMAVLFSAKTLFSVAPLLTNTSFATYMHSKSTENIDALINQWPCLAGDTAICVTVDDDRLNAVIH